MLVGVVRVPARHRLVGRLVVATAVVTIVVVVAATRSSVSSSWRSTTSPRRSSTRSGTRAGMGRTRNTGRRMSSSIDSRLLGDARLDAFTVGSIAESWEKRLDDVNKGLVLSTIRQGEGSLNDIVGIRVLDHLGDSTGVNHFVNESSTKRDGGNLKTLLNNV